MAAEETFIILTRFFSIEWRSLTCYYVYSAHQNILPDIFYAGDRFSGASKPGAGGNATYLFAQSNIFHLFSPFTEEVAMGDHFPFVHIPGALKAMLHTAQISRIPRLSPTLVTRPLHFECCFHAPILQHATFISIKNVDLLQ